MTKEQAIEKAEMRVWCYMNSRDIDYYFTTYGLSVFKPDGKKKPKPTRSEKEEALIEYLANDMCNQSDEFVEKQQEVYKQICMHDIEIITNR